MRVLQEHSGATIQDLILQAISALNIIDFGVIVNVCERDPDDSGVYNGVYADVRRLDATFIQNAEVLFIGGRGCVIDCAPTAGDPCLILGTKRNIASLNDLLSSPASAYGEETVKVIPLGSIVTAQTRLLLDRGAALVHKSAAFGIDANGVLYSQSIGQDGHTTRHEAYYPDGSFRKVFNNLKAVQARNPDFSNEWTLYDDQNKIISYLKEDMDGNLTRLQGENTDVETEFSQKTWKHEKSVSVKDGFAKSETVKDSEDKILYRRIFKSDGTIEYYLYEQSAGGGDFLITQKTSPDGAFQTTVSDGAADVCTVAVAPDGTLTMESGGNLAFKSAQSGKLTVGNSTATLGAMVADLFTALQGFHSEGSPGSHTAASWYAASVQPIAAKWAQVFD
jgi:hypothetical protein